MKKNILLAALIIISLVGNAATKADFSGVEFGVNYAEASQQLETLFGIPTATSPTQIAYKNKEHLGLTFNDVVFNFQKNSEGKTFLNEARLTRKAATKAEARQQVEEMAKRMSEKYPGTSWDLEENGNKFYKGGTSPVNNSYLFTIYMYRSNGQYLAVLRYGPLPYVK